MLLRKFRFIISLPVVLGLFLFCEIREQTTGTVDDTDTGISVYLPDSTPAVDAVIKFIPSTRTQSSSLLKRLMASSPVAVVKTDSKGQFQVPALVDSTYNVFMEKGDLKAYQGEVVITKQGNTIHDDTLHKTGSFKAIVGLDPKDMHNVGTVAVQILGSDVQYTNPDKNGMFTFKDIAAGNYKLRLETNLPEYSPTFFTMTIKSNKDTILPDTIFMKYTGIPSVSKLSATFDTSRGIVKLSWRPTGYSNILDYVIYRDAEPTVTYSNTPYKATSDTSLIDTIFDIRKIPIDTQTVRFKYRIAIRNNSTMIGNTFGAISVSATPYKSVLPVIDSIKVLFDTLSGTANVSWKCIPQVDSNYSYFLLRTIKPVSTGLPGELSASDIVDTIKNVSLPTISDSLYGKKFSFKDNITYRITYSISVFKKDWKLAGKESQSTPLLITPYKTRVPLITKLNASFDTLHGISLITWDSIPAASAISGYRVVRTLTRLSQLLKVDTLPVLTSNILRDTIYPKLVSFDETRLVKVTYSVSAYHSLWGIYGEDATILDTVYSYKAFPPRVSAGADQTVDIGSDVFLMGIVTKTTFPIVKKEWKVGDSAWVIGKDSVQFSTNSELTREIIPCLFRVTDSMGNLAVDTVVVTKTPLVVTLSKFPSQVQATPTITKLPLTKKLNSENDYLFFGYIDNRLYGIYSTSDFINYSMLTAKSDIFRYGAFFTFKNNYYVYNITFENTSDKCYKSSDAISWSEITLSNSSTVNPYNRVFIFKDYLLAFYKNYIGYDKKPIYQNILFKSSDGINWDSISSNLPKEEIAAVLPVGNSLCLITTENKYISSGNEFSWSPDKFWDTDGDIFPDDFYTFATSDSLTLVAYQERPSLVNRIAMYKNGVWKNLPIESLNITPQNGTVFKMCIIENKVCLFYDGLTVKSLKLY